MSDFLRDLQTLKALGPLCLEPDYVEAQPCLRVDLTCPGPLSKRPGNLDPFLEKAAALMQGSLTYYGAESEGTGFAASKGRKPNQDDIAQLARVSELMRIVERADAAEKEETKAHLRAQGVTPTDGPNWTPVDHGTLYLSDSSQEEESQSHIMLLGFGAWGISLSFSLDLALFKPQEILELAEGLLKSGFGTSASFGFAYNTVGSTSDTVQEKVYLPPTRRFRLLNMMCPGSCRPMRDEAGLIPINSWYQIDKICAAQNGLSEEALRSLDGQVHVLSEDDHGFFIKLYENPVLADLNEDTNLAPACALGAVLEPVFAKHPFAAAVPLGEQADCIAWLRRFGPEFAA